ncbi:D-alanine--D-alanine ligase [Derxia gummosa]|uniref:D-alanine--D-alanine ligase n=1 Tax=Derxia gummosa DSM 723 TaxID=1121388 RepID=A0A8B6X7B2_9BURK|nr:D-alanine--D-alanine ligase [Derxia gummosa]
MSDTINSFEAPLAPLAIEPASLGKVVVLYGGTSAEREVSIKSGSMVHAALLRSGVDATLFDTGTQALAGLAEGGFDRAVISLHGRGGEDGTIQGHLELIGLPYTGSGVMASAVAMDKVFTKRIWQTHGLPTPKYRLLRRGDDLAQAAAELGLPLFMKPPHEGSTVGASKVTSADGMAAAFDLAAKYDDGVLAEQFIAGAELTCAVIERAGRAVALPAIRIVAPGGNYDYNNKYLTNDTRYLCPAGLPPEVERRVRELAVASFEALGCAGWARADFMLPGSDGAWGEPTLLEINTSPGMTDHSLVPMAARASGISYEQLVVEIAAGAALKGGLGKRREA